MDTKTKKRLLARTLLTEMDLINYPTRKKKKKGKKK